MMTMQLCLNALDAEAFSVLRSSCGLPPLESFLLENCIEGSLFTLMAVACAPGGEQPVAMLRVVGDGVFVFHIYDVMVAPAFQRQGLGQKLVRAAIDRIKSYSAPGRWVTIHLQASPGREEFYKKLGFFELPDENFGTAMQLIEKS